jgi:polysaccharide biosynthesis transport protein
MQDSKLPPLKELLAVWRRRRAVALLAFAAGIVACASLVIALPDIYRSTATILVERDEAPADLVTAASRREFDIQLKVVNHEVLSRSRLEQLIDRFDLYPEASKSEPRGPYVEALRKEINLDVEAGAPVWGRDPMFAFSIGFQGTDREKVAAVTNALAAQYVQENADTQQRLADGTSEVLGDQARDVERRLKQQEQRIAEFTRRHMGALPDQVTSNLRTLERLNSQLQHNRERRLLAPSSDPEAGQPATESPSMALARLKNERTKLLTRFSDSYPDVVSVGRQIDALEQQLADAGAEPQRGVQPKPSSPDSEDSTLQREIAEYQHRVDAAPQREIELQELSRDYDTTKELYHSLLRRGEELRFAGRMEQHLSQGRFRVLEPAVPGEHPHGPDRPKLMLAGLAFAAFLVGASVLVAEQLDGSFHSTSSLKAFSRVPILVSIPRITTVQDRRRRRGRATVWLAGALACLGLVAVLCYRFAHDNEALVLMLSRGHR